MMIPDDVPARIRRHAEYLDEDLRWLEHSRSYRLGRVLTQPWTLLARSPEPLPELRQRPGITVDVPDDRHCLTVELELLAPAGELRRAAIIVIRCDGGDQALSDLMWLSGAYQTSSGEYFVYADIDSMGRFSKTLCVPPASGRVTLELRPWRTDARIFVKSFTASFDAPPVTCLQATSGDRSHRVALYADLNINIVDGSSIWLASLAKVLAHSEQVAVDVFLKHHPERTTVLSSILDDPGIAIYSLPDAVLDPALCSSVIRTLQQRSAYDLIIVRGYRANALMAHQPWTSDHLCPYITDLPEPGTGQDEQNQRLSRRVIHAARYLLCQTPAIAEYYESVDPAATAKTVAIPPMVPNDIPRVSHGFRRPTFRIVYAGKFARLWATEEMLDAFATVRRKFPSVELHVFGDKFHRDALDPEFEERIRERLSTDQGVVWYRAVSREDVLHRLCDMDMAWAWRSPELEEVTRELSTKILEYAAASLPTLLFENGINRELLGPDYPLFAQSPGHATDLIERVVSDRTLLDDASQRISAATSDYGFTQAARQLAALL